MEPKLRDLTYDSAVEGSFDGPGRGIGRGAF
jgi:hypothetical protein